jgi:phage-related minor tail protein
MYMVGEKGPELFMPATPGRILSHGALAGGAGGAVVQLNYAPVIDARGADAAAVARLEAGQTAIVAQFEPMVHRAVQNLRARRKL